ncbi:MAG: hypothetical protein IKA74_00415 [Clostridia bacterium]|nr:hypothetical protein [Clostridia bacterium]
MLNSHLIAKLRPRANEKNVLRWKNARITVLSERLFRIERSENGEFCDSATLAVFFRDFEPVDFVSVDKGDFLEIKTPAVTLLVGKDNDGSCVIIDEKEIRLDNSENLLGTYWCLDCCDGTHHAVPWDPNRPNSVYDIELENGVVARNGVAVYDDSKTPLIGEDGKPMARAEGGSDLYVFAFGHDYRGAVRALYSICGPVPQIPRFALGNWWSRYHEYSDNEYINLLDSIEESGVPLTVATIDIDWHWTRTLDKVKKITESGRDTDFYGGKNGWTGYSWNTDLFPDYKKFLNRIKERNLNITLNLHPAEGVRWFEDMYRDMALAVGVDPDSGERVKFDLTNEKFVNAYFDILHHPYERDGVKFWWIDYQQGRSNEIDPLWLLNHYHFLDNSRDKDGVILSRYAGIGSHRYPVGFTGDTIMTWETMKYLPKFTLTATNAGYTWWSHDIGGHMYGYKDNELFVRGVQFGVFSPINRLHCYSNAVVTKEPDTFVGGSGKIVAEFMRLRHRMIPLLSTASHRNTVYGEALIEPMYYEYPENERAYTFDSQYMFAGSMLVAPITEHSDKSGFAKKRVWLPKGKWTDILSCEEYRGGRELTVVRPLDSMPVFAKEGAIIPLDARKDTNSTEIPDALEILVCNGKGSYELYENNENGADFTKMSTKVYNKKQYFSIKTEKKSCVVPQKRRITVRFLNVRSGDIEVLENKKPIAFDVRSNKCLRVIFDMDTDKEYTVIVKYESEPEILRVKNHVLRVLQYCEGENHGERQRVWWKIRNYTDKKEIAKEIRASSLHRTAKAYMLELI